MEGQFFRSYKTFEMYPLTIHCKGLKYKNATILSAGFAVFGCDIHKVSAYVTLQDGDPELAKVLLDCLNHNGNFSRNNPDFSIIS